MIKKISIIFIVFVMAIMIAPGIYSEAKTDEEITADNAELLANLGIISGEESINLSGKMTKSNFLKAVSVIVGTDEKDEAILSYLKMNKTANLNDAISESFVSEVLVKMLGYGDIAKRNYPTGDSYLFQAQRLKLFKDVKNSKRLTSGDAYNMIANALESEMLAINGVNVSGDGAYENVMTKYDTALYYYMKVFKVSGVLNTTSGTSLFDNDSIGKDRLKIGNEVYSDNNKDYDILIGCFVVAYVKENDEIDTVIYMTKEDENELEISNDDFISYDALSGELKFYDANEKVKSTTLSADMILMYNGTRAKNFDNDVFKQKNGKIRLIDNNDDHKYEVACIEVYEHMIVSSINETTHEIKNMLTYEGALGSIKLDEENEEHKIIINKDGEKISLKDIPRRASLRVYANPSNPKQIIKVYVSDKTISGTVTATQSDNKKVTIDGTEYAISANLRYAMTKTVNGKSDKYAPNLEVGKAYTFYIDDLGEISASDKDVKSSYRYGLMTKAVKVDDSFDKIVKIKLFDEGGQLKEYEFDTEIEYNKQKKVEPEKAYDTFAPNGKVTNQLVAYRLNKDGKINKFYTAVSAADAVEDDVLVQGNKITAAYQGTYESSFYVGTDIVFIDTNSVIWIAPEDSDADSCKVLTLSGLYTTTTYTVTPYNVDEYSAASLFVVDENSLLRTSMYKLGALFIVSDKGEAISGGEAKDYIEGVSNHFTSMNMTFKDDAKGVDQQSGKSITFDALKKGDVMSPIVDTSGDITSFKRWFSIDQRTEESSFAIENDLWSHGQVKSTDDVNGRVLVTNNGKNIPIRLTSSSIYYVCESNKAKNKVNIRQGTASDISEGDYVAIKNSRRVVQTMIIYKDE